MSVAPFTQRMKLKTMSAKAYLFASLFSLFFAGVLSMSLTPLFLKVFIPFPTLEEAQVLTGTVEVVGKWSSRKGPARYFIAHERGRTQVWCGLPKERLPCFGSDTHAQGATGTVWFHPTFGVLQWDLTLHTPRAEGYREKGTYQVEKTYFEKPIDYDDYYGSLLAVAVALSISIYQFIRFRRLRIVERQQLKGAHS